MRKSLIWYNLILIVIAVIRWRRTGIYAIYTLLCRVLTFTIVVESGPESGS